LPLDPLYLEWLGFKCAHHRRCAAQNAGPAAAIEITGITPRCVARAGGGGGGKGIGSI